jgi:hypothetical protein
MLQLRFKLSNDLHELRVSGALFVQRVDACVLNGELARYSVNVLLAAVLAIRPPLDL